MPSTTNAVADDPRAARAYDQIRALSEIPERCAGTDGERLAAERTADWMRGLGLDDVQIQTIPARARTGYTLALHAGIGLAGVCWGGWFGVLLALAALYSFRHENLRQKPALSRLLDPPPSVNVIGRRCRERARRRVVLSAHIDTAQAGFIFSREVAALFAGAVRRRGDDSRPPVGPLALPNFLLVSAALLSAAGWAGATGVVFELARALASAGLLLTAAAGLQWALSPATPGANDNASAVAAMFACAEKLLPSLPDDVELWLAGTGAEEVGCDGMAAFLHRYGEWPREDVLYINFECVGGGALHAIHTEGLLDKVVYPPALLETARRVAASGAFGEVTATDLLAGTDGHVPARRGYPTLSLITLHPNGVPRNYHQKGDTVDALDMQTVLRAADFGAAVAAATLFGETGPILPL